MNQPTSKLTRRSFAAACGSASAAALGAWPSTGINVNEFRELSAELTGFPASALDVQFAAELAEALAAVGLGDELKRRLKASGGAFHDLETEIIAAWYSGVLPTPSGPVVGTFQGALIWPALVFAAPPGLCRTPQSWSEPPAASA